MKEQNTIFSDLNKGIIIFLLFIFIMICTSSIDSFVNHKKMLKNLEKIEIKGKINHLKNLTRGSYNIVVGKYEMRSINIGYEIEKYNIQTGDSFYKMANSKIITFYKMKNGYYEKTCEYEL